MNTQTLILIGVGVVALLGAVGAFAIAFRRSGMIKGPADWRRNVSRETLEADRPQAVMVPAAATVPADMSPAESEEEEPEPATAAVAVAEVQRVVEVSPEESGVTRRQFFNRALAATFGSFLALLGIDMLAFFWPKVSGGFGADVDAGDVNEITARAFTADGSVVPVFVPEARAYVVPVDEAGLSPQFKDKSVAAGGLMALYQRCVHLGCRVPWCATSIGFECPCHGSKYDYIGEYFAGPAPRNLDRFVVEVKDDRLIIKTGSILETPRAPVRSVAYPQGPSCIGDIAVEA
ncbi:MAG TPA: ubiquinol-cytochrome c reductase iron-sulfur subunit [Acidimicrobiia bacterium]